MLRVTRDVALELYRSYKCNFYVMRATCLTSFFCRKDAIATATRRKLNRVVNEAEEDFNLLTGLPRFNLVKQAGHAGAQLL